jgi:hypothetical protein
MYSLDCETGQKSWIGRREVLPQKWYCGVPGAGGVRLEALIRNDLRREGKFFRTIWYEWEGGPKHAMWGAVLRFGVKSEGGGIDGRVTDSGIEA